MCKTMFSSGRSTGSRILQGVEVNEEGDLYCWLWMNLEPEVVVSGVDSIMIHIESTCGEQIAKASTTTSEDQNKL